MWESAGAGVASFLQMADLCVFHSLKADQTRSTAINMDVHRHVGGPGHQLGPRLGSYDGKDVQAKYLHNTCCNLVAFAFGKQFSSGAGLKLDPEEIRFLDIWKILEGPP